jgi:hypothetical protein
MSETVKIIATVPQITFTSIELEMPAELYEMGNEDEQTEFVWNHLSSIEQDWCPNGLKGYRDAKEVDYATIKKVKQ